MKKETITVHVKLAGFIDRRMVTAEFDLAVPAGTTIREMFALADKSGNVPGKAMRKLLSSPRPPTVLVNGRGIEVPAELRQKLSSGDEVAVMTPFAGG